MATTIRLARGGAKKRPYYRIVVASSRYSRDGRFIEKIGTYNPLLPKDDANRVQIDTERAKYWVGTGAQLSERIQRMFYTAGIVTERPKFLDSGRRKKAEIEAEEAARVAAAEKEAAEKAAAEAPAEEAVAEAPAEEAAAEEKAEDAA